MKKIHIVAMAKNGCIGIDGGLPWSIPSDLKYFKEKTVGKAVVVGRKTYDSLPPKVFSNRSVYSVSRSKGNLLTEDYLESLRSFHSSSTDLMIAGGAEVYEQTLHLADELLITEVDLEAEGDSYYPPFVHLFDKVYTSENFEENGITFRFTSWIPKATNQNSQETNND